jgi:HK97 family phage major capsid protein
MKIEKQIKCGPIFGIYTLDRKAATAEDGSFQLTFSSETPIYDPWMLGDRGAYIILDHSPESVDLSRAESVGLAIRDGHCGDQVGITDDVSISADRKGQGKARFGKGARADEIRQDVANGIRRAVSVRFEPMRLRFERKEENGIETYRATRWAPIHVAVVPDGADYNVGFNRDKADVHEAIVETEEEQKPVIAVTADRDNTKGGKNMKCDKCGTELVGGTCPKCSHDRAKADFETMRADRKKKNDEIRTLGEKYGQRELAAEFIMDEKSPEEFKDRMLEKVKAGEISFGAPAGAAGEQQTKGGFRSLGEQLQAVARAERPGATPDPRLVFDRTAPQGMNEGVPSDGGFLVQDTFTTALLSRIVETGLLYKKCYRIPIGPGSNGINAPRIKETTRATGSRLGGVQVYRDPEGQEATAKRPKFSNLEMKLKKLHGLCYVSDEMLQDVVQLESIVGQSFGEEFGFVCDDEIIRGDGASQMLGILAAPALVSVSAETNQKTDTIISENVMKIYARMPARNKTRAEWYINDECWPQLFSLYIAVGTGGVPIFVPPAGLAAAPFGTLFGRPILPIEQASGLGDLGDIIFADLGEYAVIDKGDMEAKASMHVRFIYDEMAYKFTIRNNGQPIWESAITPYKGTASTKSPYLALAAR